MTKPALIDRQGRTITYLRLSVTDRCDLRCHYCLPERPKFLPKNEIMTLEQMAFLAKIFISHGVNKIRITGGEPLVRRNVLWLIEKIAKLPGLKELVLTTNGTMLAANSKGLLKLGVKRLNISLDTLNPDRFLKITRNGDLNKVLNGIETACSTGFEAIRINTVMMSGTNDDEIIDLVNYAISNQANISFIEEMPMGETGRDRPTKPMSADDLLALLETEFQLTATDYSTGGPAKYWSVAGTKSLVGIIAPHTRNFCSSCNRVRLTCTGDLFPCLGHHGKVSLADCARNEDFVLAEKLIRSSLSSKPDGHEFDMSEQTSVMRYMAVTGG